MGRNTIAVVLSEHIYHIWFLPEHDGILYPSPTNRHLPAELWKPEERSAFVDDHPLLLKTQ